MVMRRGMSDRWFWAMNATGGGWKTTTDEQWMQRSEQRRLNPFHYRENYILLHLADPPVWWTDGQTDGRAIAYSALKRWYVHLPLFLLLFYIKDAVKLQCAECVVAFGTPRRVKSSGHCPNVTGTDLMSLLILLLLLFLLQWPSKKPKALTFQIG